MALFKRRPAPEQLRERRHAESEAWAQDQEDASFQAEIDAGLAIRARARAEAEERARREAEERAREVERADAAWRERYTAEGRARLYEAVDKVMEAFDGMTTHAARGKVTEDGRRRRKTFTDPKPVLESDRGEVAAAILRRSPGVSLAWFQVYMRALGCSESGAALKVRWRIATDR